MARLRRDCRTAVAFLTTRVSAPAEDDWGKLRRVLRYLKRNPSLPLVLEADDISLIHWHVDAPFAVHADMKSHTGGTMSIGKGSVIDTSHKQKINTRSSTVDLQGQEQPPRHFWAGELRHWVDSAEQRARFFNDLFRSEIIVRTDWANEALLAAGYRLLNAPPLDADGFILTATHGATTRTTDTARMTLGDIGQWLFRMETTAAGAHTPVGNETAQAVLLYMRCVPSNPQWWTPAPLRNTTLARL